MLFLLKNILHWNHATLLCKDVISRSGLKTRRARNAFTSTTSASSAWKTIPTTLKSSKNILIQIISRQIRDGYNFKTTTAITEGGISYKIV